jgi:hypothetical protein
MLVNGLVICEQKATEALKPFWQAQVLSLENLEVGVLDM